MVGFVQFDPWGDNEFDGPQNINGEEAFKFSIRAIGFQGQPNVTVTLWERHKASFEKIQKGALVAVDGQYTLYTNDSGKKYHNLSAFSLAVLPVEAAEETERKGVTNPVEDAGDDDLPF